MDAKEIGLWLAKLLGLIVLTALVARVELAKRGLKGSHVERLVSLCRGNRAEAYRLMKLEKTRAPEISEKTAYERAIARLERDRSR